MPFKRRPGKPRMKAATVAVTPPARKLIKKGTPCIHNRRVKRAPMPKKAAWPRLICPAKPPTMFQLEARAAMMKSSTAVVRMLLSFVSSGNSRSARATTPRSTFLSVRAERNLTLNASTLTRSPSDIVASKQPLRPYAEHDEEDNETNNLAITAAKLIGAERFGNAQQETGEQGTAHAAQPGEDDDNERLERPLQADGG